MKDEKFTEELARACSTKDLESILDIVVSELNRRNIVERYKRLKETL